MLLQGNLMDELDRPGTISPKTINNNSTLSSEDMGNRPPVAMDESYDCDEVDQVKNPSSPPVFDSVDDARVERPTAQRQESGMLSSITSYDELPPVHPPLVNKITEEDKEVEEMLLTIDQPYDVNKFNLELMPPPSPPPATLVDDDATDGPPGATSPSSTTQTDGPFTSVFFKPSQPEPVLVQHRSERKNREGIVVKHTTYYPKPLDAKSMHYKTSADYASQVYSDNFYKMDCFPRGKLTLINVKYFTRASGMGDYPREGTNRDAEGLTDLFLDMGFVVDRFDNPSKKEILAIVKQASNENYSDKGCCACAVLSHGEEGLIYGNDDFVKIKDITKMFQTRGLAGKPKFFLFQACQGSEYMNPIDSVDGPGGRRMTEEEMALALPVEADFLYAYSTVPGYYSWRNSRRGSWFMEALVQVFRENAHKMDVMRMLVRVNDIISFRKSRTDDVKTDNKRQIASLVTQMRKDFFMFPAYGPLPK